MSYIKTTWVNDQTELNAENMNKIEQGIASAYAVWLVAVTDEEPEECYAGDIYFNTETRKLYVARERNVWDGTGFDPEIGVMYIVFETKSTYSYNGYTLISVGGGSGSQVVVDPDEPTEDTKLYIESMDLDGNYEVNTQAYSTSEVLTNEVWIDGKPIYRKVVDFGAMPNTTTKQVAHNASNVADIWVDFGNSFMKNSVDDYYGVSDYDWHTYVDETYVYMTSEYDRSDSNAYITIKYTKTTD